MVGILATIELSMKNTLALIPVVVCFSLLTGYNFMSAQWSAPTAAAPGNNTAAPINVSSTTQAKSGNLMANIFAATIEMRSNRYCDALGGNCTTAGSLGSNGPVYKFCSVAVGGSWRDTILVPAAWTATNCQNFMTSVGAAGYSFGCVTSDGYFFADDVACDAAASEPMPSRKVCSVVAASGNWRDTVNVPTSFTDTQCASYQSGSGASARQMGCITDTGVVFGNTAACNSGGSTAPQDLKVCTVALSGNWRDTINVPADWDLSLCTVFGYMTGASGSTAGYSLGCALPTGLTFGSTRSCS